MEVFVAIPSSEPTTPDAKNTPVENSAGAQGFTTIIGGPYAALLNGGNEIVPKTKSPWWPRSADICPLSPVASDSHVPAQSPLTSRGVQDVGHVQVAVHAPSHSVPVAAPS